MEENEILTELHKIITLELAKRRKEVVIAAFNRLGVSVSQQVEQFYFNFSGPLGKKMLGGDMLLDIVADNPNIESLTKTCREQFGFPNYYLAITDCNDVGEVTVLDTLSNKLYTVCLECGEDEDLLKGKLKPQWESFNDFLVDFFNIH